MKKILIILHDTILLTTFKIWLHNNKNNNSDVILVAHCLEGPDILEKNKIDTIIMDLEIEEFDAFNLLVICMKEYSKIHLIILSDALINNNYSFSSFNYLKKSSSLNKLKCLLKDIREKSLNLKIINDILIADFFHLIQMKQKTCLIEIKSENKKGFIYFNQGELFDCLYNNDKGERAFFKILNEKCEQFILKNIPAHPFSRHIMTPLADLIKTYNIEPNYLSSIDQSSHENKQIIEVDELKPLLDDNDENNDESLIIKGLVERKEDENLAKKTTYSSKLIIEKQPAIQPKKINAINSPKKEIKVLDRMDKKSEDEIAISVLNDEVEVVFKKSKLTGKEKMALQDCLTPLQTIDGYLASAIFDMSGEVLVQHNNSKYNVSLIGAHAISMINSAVKALNGGGLGKCNFIQVNSEKGIFGAVWAVEDHSVAAVLLEPNANIGMAKLLLAKVGEAGGSQLA